MVVFLELDIRIINFFVVDTIYIAVYVITKVILLVFWKRQVVKLYFTKLPPYDTSYALAITLSNSETDN